MLPRIFLPAVLAALVAIAAHSPDGAAASHSESSSHSHTKKSKAKGAPGEYDYYVMALSWSPTFCEAHPEEDEQCAHKGFGFVLHGLWPQYDGGGGPERCDSDDEPDKKTIARTLAFMPSMRLINHEWRAHGACTGLGPSAYFDLADRAFAAIHVPPVLSAPRAALHMNAGELRGALEGSNPGLADNMLSLHCSDGELVEVRVCLDKGLAPRACGKRMRTGCPVDAAFTIPATR